jgi:uncharacterized protein (DUF1800 family)
MRYTTLLSIVGVIGVAGRMPGQAPMSPTDSARHVLDRLGYGGTPGEVEAVARTGVLKWVDRQLGYDDVADPALAPLEEQYEVTHASNLDMQQLLAANRARVKQAQAGADSGQRAQALAALRQDQRGDRHSLQNMIAQLQSLTLARAVESDHQLDEVLTDFWTNHFNVYINKGVDRAYFADYLDHTIRPHALGKFEDLLLATAHSPAMLFYLDNAESVASGTDQNVAARRQALAARFGRNGGRRGVARAGVFPDDATAAVPANNPAANPAANRAPHGINENYARELMELHTLGVNGGYTQADVIAVARVLTGWSIDRRTAGFIFRPATHDDGDKVVLGMTFPAGHGEDEGVRLLKYLANAPATMHHVSAELCARFVNDTPPDGCIDDAVRAWKNSGGDIRQVMRAIIDSPDFWAAANLHAKAKSPLEFVASAVRAVQGIPDSTPRLAQRVALLGEPLFQKQTPDGYGEREADWINSGALLARWNFAMQLASGRMPGVTVDLDRVVPVGDDHTQLVDAVNHAVLGGAMSDHTRGVILKELTDVTDPRAARALAVGMAIGSPEFQRR